MRRGGSIPAAATAEAASDPQLAVVGQIGGGPLEVAGPVDGRRGHCGGAAVALAPHVAGKRLVRDLLQQRIGDLVARVADRVGCGGRGPRRPGPAARRTASPSNSAASSCSLTASPSTATCCSAVFSAGGSASRRAATMACSVGGSAEPARRGRTRRPASPGRPARSPCARARARPAGCRRPGGRARPPRHGRAAPRAAGRRPARSRRRRRWGPRRTVVAAGKRASHSFGSGRPDEDQQHGHLDDRAGTSRPAGRAPCRRSGGCRRSRRGRAARPPSPPRAGGRPTPAPSGTAAGSIPRSEGCSSPAIERTRESTSVSPIGPS